MLTVKYIPPAFIFRKLSPTQVAVLKTAHIAMEQGLSHSRQPQREHERERLVGQEPHKSLFILIHLLGD